MVIKVVGIRGNLDEQNRKRDKERLTKVNGGDFSLFSILCDFMFILCKLGPTCASCLGGSCG